MERGITPGLFRKYLVQNYGESVIESLSPRLSAQARDMLVDPDFNRWYPVSLMREFYEAVAGALMPGDENILLNMGRFVADESATGFLRYLTRLISVPILISRLGAFWKHYHKGGSIRAEMTSRVPGGYQGWVTIEGYPAGPNGRPAMQGYMEATLARAGARDLRMERNSPPDNDEDIYSWKLNWQKTEA